LMVMLTGALAYTGQLPGRSLSLVLCFCVPWCPVFPVVSCPVVPVCLCFAVIRAAFEAGSPGKGLRVVWLAIIILGRDLGLGIAALYYRWISLPPPKTMHRYWDFSLPSAEVHPTTISKVGSCPLKTSFAYYSPLIDFPLCILCAISLLYHCA